MEIAALSGVFEEAEFEAKTAGYDELGVWIDLGDESAILSKWHYLAAMVVSLPPGETDEPRSKRIGF